MDGLSEAAYQSLVSRGLRQRLPGAPSRALALGALQPGTLVLSDVGTQLYFVLQVGRGLRSLGLKVRVIIIP